MFVLSVCLIVTVLAMGAIYVTNASGRTVADANDWDTAGTLAFSATEQAMAVLNAAAAASPSSWRSAYTNGQVASTSTIGRGTMSWELKDEADANLTDDYLESFRVYGIGKCGNATRVYSVLVSPGGSPLDVLRTALHDNANVNLTGTPQAINGPVSSNATVALVPGFTGSVEAKATTGNDPNATVTTNAATKTMPSANVLADLQQQATVIPYSSLSGGKLQNCLLSASSNPYGATNPNGIYSIAITGNSDLTISNCRIVGTLLITGPGNKNNVNVNGPITWDPGPTGAPIMIISCPGAIAALAGSNTWLTESSAGVNLNPASTPFQGSSDTNTTDDFPPQYHGIIHVINGSSGSVTLNANFYLVGTLITDSPVKTTAETTLIQDPTMYANPPFGYQVGNVLSEVAGSWRWDGLP